MRNSPNTYLIFALLIGITLAYLRRREPIGGWLFYFFFALYAGFATVPFSIEVNLRALNSNNWPVKGRYGWYLIGTLPLDALYLATVISASILLIARSERQLRILRTVILLTLIATVICGVLMVFQPKLERLALPNFTAALSALFWSLYFYRSVRVKRVFISHDWREHPPLKT